jgi:hypothetical protein
MWIKSQLNGNAVITGAVGIGNMWELPIPQGRGFPAIGFNQLSSIDVVATAHYRIMVNELWLIRLIAEQSSHVDSLAIVDQLDTLFHKANGVADGATIFSSTRANTYRLSEDKDGKEYRHTGAVYRIYAQRN